MKLTHWLDRFYERLDSVRASFEETRPTNHQNFKPPEANHTGRFQLVGQSLALHNALRAARRREWSRPRKLA